MGYRKLWGREERSKWKFFDLKDEVNVVVWIELSRVIIIYFEGEFRYLFLGVGFVILVVLCFRWRFSYL